MRSVSFSLLDVVCRQARKENDSEESRVIIMKKVEKKRVRKVESKEEEGKLFEEIDLRTEPWDPNWRGNTFVYEPMFGKIVHLYVGSPNDMVKLLAFGPEEKKGDVDPRFAIDTVARVGGIMLKHQTAYGFTVPSGADIYICMRKLDIASLKDIDTLEHECLHAAYIILHQAGVEFGEGAEILARMQGFLFRRLMENLVNGCKSVVKPDGTLEPIHDTKLLLKGV